VIDGRCQRDYGVAGRKPQTSSIRAVACFLATGNGAGRQMAENALIGERGAHRQPKAHCPRRSRVGAESGRSALAQIGRRAFEHQAHSVVELADAGKAGGERDVAERQVCRLDQQPGGLASLRASQRERAGTDLGLQDSFQLPGGVTEVGGQSADAVTVHRAVGDEPHGPCNDVAAHVPLGRTRRSVGTASLARPETSPLRGRRRR
jgi:hypothetical protein